MEAETTKQEFDLTYLFPSSLEANAKELVGGYAQSRELLIQEVENFGFLQTSDKRGKAERLLANLYRLLNGNAHPDALRKPSPEDAKRILANDSSDGYLRKQARQAATLRDYLTVLDNDEIEHKQNLEKMAQESAAEVFESLSAETEADAADLALVTKGAEASASLAEIIKLVRAVRVGRQAHARCVQRRQRLSEASRKIKAEMPSLPIVPDLNADGRQFALQIKL